MFKGLFFFASFFLPSPKLAAAPTALARPDTLVGRQWQHGGFE